MIATAVVLLFVLVLVLAWYGFVPLNWSMVTHAFLRRRSGDQDGWVAAVVRLGGLAAGPTDDRAAGWRGAQGVRTM